jgi:hypothetical protein
MERTYIAENKRERERLRKLVNVITDEELTLILYQEGWTIAVALAHLAFWDQRRLVLVRKWKQQGVSPSPGEVDALSDTIVDMINDTLVPFFLELPPRKAASMAVSIAEEIDRELENLSPEIADAITSLGDHHALNRSIHRKMHLDDIANQLKISRGKK